MNIQCLGHAGGWWVFVGASSSPNSLFQDADSTQRRNKLISTGQRMGNFADNHVVKQGGTQRLGASRRHHVGIHDFVFDHTAGGQRLVWLVVPDKSELKKRLR